MACYTVGSASPRRDVFCNCNKLSSTNANSYKRPMPVFISSVSERRASYNPLVFQAAKLLGPPARFEASKLKVVFIGEGMDKYTGIVPRTYTLSHCDITADLTLSVSNAINLDQLRGWYNKDDVVAEWKKVKEEMFLHVHCHVLKAVLHGDSILFKEHPELLETLVWVYFHSSSKKYNRVECWGPLKDAAQVKYTWI
uniref:Staygreen protein domain-containing protein n=1 Tax=Nelumbo nucifera TaxID=4432 RepID=A0A822XSP5_NELNU|nr:TPA_asm: hypothetical protein HUJ06_024186 [Nelumbo nucifera]